MFKRLANRETTMRDRFIFRVLLPPFLLLIVIGGLGYWQFNKTLSEQAVDELSTAATTTSIRLERELAIREDVLKNTAMEIADAKNNYESSLLLLENNRTACREHYLQSRSFIGSPDGACDSFSQSEQRPSLSLIEDSYIKTAQDLQKNQVDEINQRLAAYKQFFPETIAITVANSDGEIISSAVSGELEINADNFTELATKAVENSIDGELLNLQGIKLAIFAYPTESGSVLAAYDVNNENFIYPSWSNAPIESKEASAVIIEPGINVVYPAVRNQQEFIEKTNGIESESTVKENLSGVENIVIARNVSGSRWQVLIASPEAIVLSSVRDTQFIIMLIIGVFVVGFLWMGTYFIKKTTDNIAHLVTGALVYSSGRLDYKMNIDTNEREFRQLADTMHYMAQKIAKSEQENDERNKEFISIATHELRAPMTSIIGYLSILQENIEKKLNKQDKMLLTTAYDGTIRLRDLVNDMLDAARIEGGREEFVLKNVDISDFVTDCLKSMKVVAAQSKINLEYDSKSAEHVYADEAKLRIILNNFVSNAIKYNHSNGKVTVSHSHHEGQLVTAIANTGPTIPDDQKEHMFEKFFRVDTPEHKKVTGTGIGMYVTKQYIEAMKGKVWFTSSKGKETVFYFSLPIAKKGDSNIPVAKTTPKPSNTKWIMRWRRRLK